MDPLNLSERAMLDLLLRRPNATVQQVADQLNISASTAANVLTRLQEKQLIARTAVQTSSRGRPTQTYHAMLPGAVIVFTFDASKVDGVLFDAESNGIAHIEQAVPSITQTRDAVNIAEDLTSQLIEQAALHKSDVAMVVVTLNAMRSARSGRLASSVMPWVSDTVPEAFSRKLKLPVHVLAYGMSLAELNATEEEQPESLIRFNVGDGVSSHAILFGRVARGHNLLGGELGHVTLDPNGPMCGCGKQGCVEAMVSGPAIAKHFRTQLESTDPQTSLDLSIVRSHSIRNAIDHIYENWLAGDKFTLSTMQSVFDRLAWALSISVNLLDPQVVRIDGYVLRDRDPWQQEVAARLPNQLLGGGERELTIENAKASKLDQQRAAAYSALAQTLGITTTQKEQVA